MRVADSLDRGGMTGCETLKHDGSDAKQEPSGVCDRTGSVGVHRRLTFFRYVRTDLHPRARKNFNRR
jgi:hypothetical protein